MIYREGDKAIIIQRGTYYRQKVLITSVLLNHHGQGNHRLHMTGYRGRGKIEFKLEGASEHVAPFPVIS